MDNVYQTTTTNTFNEGALDAPANSTSLYLPLPPLKPDGEIRPKITFNTLAGNRAPEIVGELQDKSEFSKSLGWDENAPKVELYIKAPGTGFYIPREYKQFVPALEQIIKHYYSQYGDDGYCAIGILQAVINPNPDTSRPFVQGHKDISPSSLKKEGQAPNHLVYVVSDAENMQTGITDYLYSDEDIAKIQKSDDPDAAQAEILNQDHIHYKSAGSAYTIVAMDSTTPHALANPAVPTARTALIVAFTGPEMTPPQNLLNPSLAQAVKLRNTLENPDNSAPRLPKVI